MAANGRTVMERSLPRLQHRRRAEARVALKKKIRKRSKKRRRRSRRRAALTRAARPAFSFTACAGSRCGRATLPASSTLLRWEALLRGQPLCC
jgi:hypothetical protein